MRPHRNLQQLLATSVALPALFLGACAPEPQSNQEAMGEALFSENCGACHGKSGGGPTLDELRALSPEQLRAAVANHPTAGQIPQRLTADTISTLIDFIEEEPAPQ